ncbi:DNA-processing protein DprA [Paenibacillus sp. CC-CFT747]|nr:DNA-processing protein DprA [Paenibacillus sp. CC-CFT747]
MDNRTALLALNEIKQVGWKTILKLVSGLPDLSGLPSLDARDLARLDIPLPLGERILSALRERGCEDWEEKYREKGIQVVTMYDPSYPALLKQTSQPPWVLYGIGDFRLLERPCLAMVGTRGPTPYGRKVAEDLAGAMARAGFCIVSGMARGIDTSAHRGAVGEKGGTIAVLGCGVDVLYPPENRAIYGEIGEKGLLLSEFPPGTSAKPGLFPLRNRIIAGLSWGTIVVEAALRSGSLITADQALEESRDVFAVPGPITSPKSLGAMSLIKQGEKLVTEPEDIWQEYAERVTDLSWEGDKEPLQAAELTSEEEAIWNLLSHEPQTLDSILEQSQTNFGHLHTILLSLTLKKKIKPLPGAAYVVI